MSLNTAISALVPALYWTLGEAPGATTITDHAGGGFPGTVSGDLGLGAFGPELDTTAARIFSTGNILSPNWGATVMSPMTVMMMVTAPGNGSPTPAQPFLGLGDINNPGTRGMRVWQVSTGANTLAYPGGGTINQVTSQVAQPIQNWHHVAFTWTQSTNTLQEFVDGVAGSPNPGSWGTLPIATDKWWVKSAYPIVLAHFAVFTRVLTQTEIQSVSTQVQTWPYQVPINTPIPVDITGSAGGLTTDQAAQLTAIDTITSTALPTLETTTSATQTTVNTVHDQLTGLISVTLPSLNDLLNTILTGITSTLTGAAGAVQKTLGQLFSHKLIDLITEVGGWSACAPDVIHAELGGGTIFGIQMECTSYPDYITFTGWGNDWTQESLGTLVISRGDNTVHRQGLHNLSHMIYPLPGTPENVFDQLLPVVPPDYTVILTPAPGCCWQMVGLGFP